MLTVRHATDADLPSLAAAEKAVFSDAWSENALASQLSSPVGISLVAEKDGVFVGYLLSVVMPPEGELYRIAVKPTCRGEGIADALMIYFLRVLSERGVTDVFLEVRASNTPAATLYEKHGFSVVGRRKNYYRFPDEDACIYRAALGEKDELC